MGIIAAYATVLGAQLTCLFTQSRGPWLGSARGCFMASCTLRARVAAHGVGLAATAALGAGLIGVLNVPGSPSPRCAGASSGGSELLETESGTGSAPPHLGGSHRDAGADPARAVVGCGLIDVRGVQPLLSARARPL